MGTDHFLKRSRHQPTTNQPSTNQPSTMNVNTSYHCESPKSDGKFTSLIALSNGSTTFDTATYGQPDQAIPHNDQPVQPDQATEFHKNVNVNFPHEDDTAVCDDMELTNREGLFQAPVKNSARKYLSNNLMLVGLAATALAIFGTRVLFRKPKNVAPVVNQGKKIPNTEKMTPQTQKNNDIESTTTSSKTKTPAQTQKNNDIKSTTTSSKTETPDQTQKNNDIKSTTTSSKTETPAQTSSIKKYVAMGLGAAFLG